MQAREMPDYGEYGGPLVSVRAYYEDGTERNVSSDVRALKDRLVQADAEIAELRGALNKTKKASKSGGYQEQVNDLAITRLPLTDEEDSYDDGYMDALNSVSGIVAEADFEVDELHERLAAPPPGAAEVERIRAMLEKALRCLDGERSRINGPSYTQQETNDAG
ncbi:MAG: hypothetical protein AAGH88_05495 [Planctomycetota bacterium]